MDDENAVSRFCNPFANVVGENEVGCARFLSVGADGQQARRFIDDDDVAVFVKNAESLREIFATRAGVSSHRQGSAGRCSG